MSASTAPFSVELLRQGLDTRFVGKQIAYYPLVSSTQDAAKAAASQDTPEGAVFIADAQTAGRGRFGRSWHASPGDNLLISILLHPTHATHSKLSIAASLATLDAIAATTGLQARLKWPNDVLIDYKKVAGVLVEGVFEGDALQAGIVGIGLNVNMRFDDVPPLPYPATSLQQELGQPVSREALARELLMALERWYLDAQAGAAVMDAWRAQLLGLGEPVTVHIGEEAVEGVAEDVDADGRLLLRLEDGTLFPLLAGDVTLRATAD